MATNEDVLNSIKSLAKAKGRILPLSLVYRTLTKEGVYTSVGLIAKTLKNLEVAGKIKSIAFGMSIELLDMDEEIQIQRKIEYVQSTL